MSNNSENPGSYNCLILLLRSQSKLKSKGKRDKHLSHKQVYIFTLLFILELHVISHHIFSQVLTRVW
jgi:hypothetical protein